jgi:hypothetical protein
MMMGRVWQFGEDIKGKRGSVAENANDSNKNIFTDLFLSSVENFTGFLL